MGFNPGKNVGRVSIRVVPDTTRFRQELRRQLATIERTTSFTVRVDKANVDRTKIRESIRRQMSEFNDIGTNANVEVTVDSARIKRGSLRKSIQAQFDEMKDVRVWIKPGIRKEDQEIFHRQVAHMVDNAEDTVNIGVQAHTAAATAQLRWVSRPRWVDIFIRINKKSLVATMTTLAALSGARLSWKWIDSLLTKIRDLDRNLPKILNWTSGLTALFAAIAGSVSGLSGIGAGLFSITPALLVVPGLFLNALASLTVLIVALRKAGDELAPLKDNMSELARIMESGFWDRARQPIIDLVTGLMPQLRNAFREVSAGVGEFTAALAKAFGEELANGRLESIFAGIAEGWRILGTGASGFAGALVNLSEIAAKYTPRLAGWFVRQANTFDAWLTAIATDRRLDRWMEQAIDSMYDLWDATRGFAGVLAGIWRAAESAGSGGLRGFGQLMLQWREIVNSAEFQRGLEAVFRGSYVAMDAFGDAIRSLGRLFSNMPQQMERFIGSVGGFLGGIFDAAFKALDNVQVRVGLDTFSAGLENALAGIKPALDPIARTFGNLLGLLGHMAENLLPTAASVLASITPVLDGLISAVEPILPTLADAVRQIASDLAPAISEFVGAATPLFQQVISELADALVELTPVISSLVSTLADVVGALSDFASNNKGFFDDLRRAITPDDKQWGLDLEGLMGGKVRSDKGFIMNWFGDASVEDMKVQARNWGDQIAAEFRDILATRGPEASQAFLAGLRQIDLPAELRADLEARFGPELDASLTTRGTAGGTALMFGLQQGVAGQYNAIVNALQATGTGAIDGFKYGVLTGKPAVIAAVADLPASMRAQIPGHLLYNAGINVAQGLANGINANRYAAIRAAQSMAGEIAQATRFALKIASPSKVMRDEVGRWIPAGIAAGIDANAYMVRRSAASAVDIDLFNGKSKQAGGMFAGTHVEVTMPLLPGETPKEQRDNLVRELSLIS